MWFRNLRLYRLTQPFSLSPEQLDAQLAEHAFRPCGGLELATYGWAPPLGRHGTLLTHAAGGAVMICARKEERVLPTAVVREAVEERAAALEAAEQRPVRSRERKALRENIVHELLPRAFTRSSHTFAYIAPRAGWLVVDAASNRKAEDLTSLLRRSLGRLAIAPPQVQQAPAAVMTQWLSEGHAPAGVVLEDECELQDPLQEGGVVRCRRQDPTAAEFHGHLEAGKRAVKLAVTWNDRLSCVLHDDLSVRRLRFTDLVQAEAEEAGSEDEAARFDADFAIMQLELNRFLDALLDLYGGEDREGYAALNAGQAEEE